MASTTETGHAKNVANFEDLISFCQGYGTTVNVKLKQGHNEDVTMALYNALGQIVDSKEYKQLDNNTVVSFNTQNLIEGVYFMRITTKKSTESLKFIISK